MNDLALIDRYNRRLTYLRISITDWCNLNCLYCSPRDNIPHLEHSEILSYEEIFRIVNIGVSLGISKIRITGGEPLVRKGVMDFIRQVAATPGLNDVGITTNAVALGHHLPALKAAGVKRLNISLDTLDPSRFARITGADRFDAVWTAILAALDAGFNPIKLNAVILRGINDDDIEGLAALSLKYPLHVRFIEYMPMGHIAADNSRPVLSAEIREKIAHLGELEPLTRTASDGPARRFRFRGAPGEIGFISPVSGHFCAQCNRLRLTASGQLRSCLLAEEHIDIKKTLRSGGSDDDLRNDFLKAARIKPEHHGLQSSHAIPICSRMSSIGG